MTTPETSQTAAPAPPNEGAAPSSLALPPVAPLDGNAGGHRPPQAQGDDGAPRSPRTWRIELPAGLKLLSLNSRLHWAERNRRAQSLKKAAWAMALKGHLPHLDRVSVVVEYQPPDHRHRDADNAATASGKPCIDGLVEAGVLTDDESPRYVTEVTYRIGEPCPKGRLVLHVTEEAP